MRTAYTFIHIHLYHTSHRDVIRTGVHTLPVSDDTLLRIQHAERQIVFGVDRIIGIFLIGDSKGGGSFRISAVDSIIHRAVFLTQREHLNLGVVNLELKMHLMVLLPLRILDIVLLLIRQRRQEVMLVERHLSRETVHPSPYRRGRTADTVINRHSCHMAFVARDRSRHIKEQRAVIIIDIVMF